MYSQKIQASAAAAAEEEGDEEEVDEYKVDVELVDELKEILEHECEQIKTHKKVIYFLICYTNHNKQIKCSGYYCYIIVS